MSQSQRLLVHLLAVLLAGALVGCGHSHVRADMDTATLIQYLQSPRYNDRYYAIDQLGARRDPTAAAPLTDLLAREQYPYLIGAVLYALAYIGAPESAPVIEGHLTHAHRKVVSAAQQALKLYELYRPYYGRPLPIVRGRPELPAGAPPPPPEAVPPPPPDPDDE